MSRCRFVCAVPLLGLMLLQVAGCGVLVSADLLAPVHRTQDSTSRGLLRPASDITVGTAVTSFGWALSQGCCAPTCYRGHHGPTRFVALRGGGTRGLFDPGPPDHRKGKGPAAFRFNDKATDAEYDSVEQLKELTIGGNRLGGVENDCDELDSEEVRQEEEEARLREKLPGYDSEVCLLSEMSTELTKSNLCFSYSRCGFASASGATWHGRHRNLCLFVRAGAIHV